MATPQMLDGLRVIELSAFVAVPLAGMTLAQLGADVIRVDPLGGGVDARRWPVTADGASLYWTGLNKGKRSMTLDVRSAAGRDVVGELVATGGPDGGILITNLPYEWLDYEGLLARRPDLIMLTLRGNRDGSAAVDYTVNAAVGYPLATGPGPEPVNHLLPAWDVIAGAQIALSILAAERHRSRHGEGTLLTMALADVALATVGHLGHIAEVTVNGHDRPPDGNYLFGAFGRDFTTADGRRVEVVAITRRQWSALLEATGTESMLEGLPGPVAYAASRDVADLYPDRHAIAARLEPWFAARPYDQVAAALDAHDVLWGPFRTFKEMVEHDPRVSGSYPLFGEIDQPGVGPVLAPGPVVDSTTHPRTPLRPAPEVGKDTVAVLRDELGYDEGRLTDLRRAGVIPSREYGSLPAS